MTQVHDYTVSVTSDRWDSLSQCYTVTAMT